MEDPNQIQQDPRFKQLEREFETEGDLNKGLFAFRGFGRSTDNVKALDLIGQEYQKRVVNLQNIIALEEQIKLGFQMKWSPDTMKDLQTALGQAQQQAAVLSQAAAKRRTTLTTTADEDVMKERVRIQSSANRNRGGVKISPAQRRMGIQVKPNVVGGVKVKGPDQAFVPQKSTQQILAPKAQSVFKKPLIPIRKVTTV